MSGEDLSTSLTIYGKMVASRPLIADRSSRHGIPDARIPMANNNAATVANNSVTTAAKDASADELCDLIEQCEKFLREHIRPREEVQADSLHKLQVMFQNKRTRDEILVRGKRFQKFQDIFYNESPHAVLPIEWKTARLRIRCFKLRRALMSAFTAMDQRDMSDFVQEMNQEPLTDLGVAIQDLKQELFHNSIEWIQNRLLENGGQAINVIWCAILYLLESPDLSVGRIKVALRTIAVHGWLKAPTREGIRTIVGQHHLLLPTPRGGPSLRADSFAGIGVDAYHLAVVGASESEPAENPDQETSSVTVAVVEEEEDTTVADGPLQPPPPQQPRDRPKRASPYSGSTTPEKRRKRAAPRASGDPALAERADDPFRNEIVVAGRPTIILKKNAMGVSWKPGKDNDHVLLEVVGGMDVRIRLHLPRPRRV